MEKTQTEKEALIALALFEAWLESGETVNAPDGFDSPEYQAFYAGMMARKRFIKKREN